MDKKDYDNPLRKQVISLFDLVDNQLEACFSENKIQQIMSISEIFDFRKIIITGCGDSLAVAGIMAKPLGLYSDTFGCKVIDPIEFTRFTPKEDIGMGEPNSPLFIAISTSGNTARIAEALEKARQIGAFTVLVTNNEKSLCTKHANKVYLMETPFLENDIPGMRSYFANMVGVAALACRLGHVRGVLPPTSTQTFIHAISSYVHSFKNYIDAMDNQMFELAKIWKSYESFNFIGDGEEHYSALFGLEKFYECTGTLSTYSDSEDWCHIDILLKDPEKIGTVIFADKNSPTFSRVVETIDVACGIGRPVLVITNAQKEEFNISAEICVLPEPPEIFMWLYPMMNTLPVTLLAGYCGALADKKVFEQFDVELNEFVDNGNTNFLSDEVMTIKNSNIEIYM